MKQFQKLLILVLALTLCLTLFAGCGKKDDPTPAEDKTAVTDPAEKEMAKPAEVGGETVTYAGCSVLVPEGFALKEPGDFSYYDFSVRKSDFSYFDFITTDDDDLIMSKYEYNKQTYTNEQVDVEAVCGDLTWTGFQYSDGWGGYGFEVYTTLDGKLIRVASAGFQFDSDVARAVLGSVAKAG